MGQGSTDVHDDQAAARSPSQCQNRQLLQERHPEPTEPETAPDWVVPRPPEGYLLLQFTNPDYRDSLFTASLSVDEHDRAFLALNHARSHGRECCCECVVSVS